MIQTILFSTDAGESWNQVNSGMAWNYAGKIEITKDKDPKFWVWSLGTGVQYSVVP